MSESDRHRVGEELAEPVPDLRKGTPKKIITIAVVVALVLGALVLGGLWMMKRAKATALERAAQGWTRFATCLLGEAPLAPGELPSHRTRAITLFKERSPKPAEWDGGRKREEAWPARCAYHAQEVRDQLRKADVDFQSSERELEITLTRQLEQLPQGKLPDRIDGTFKIVSESKLKPPARASGAEPAPPHVKPLLTKADLSPIDRYLVLRKSETDARGGLQVLFDREVAGDKKRVLCFVPQGQSVSCRSSGAALPGGGRARMLDDAHPPELFLELWDLEGESGIFSFDSGERRWTNPAGGSLSTFGEAWAIEGGFVALGRVDPKTYEITRWQAGVLASERLKFADKPDWILQFGGHVMWVETKPGKPVRWSLSARKVVAGQGGPVLEPVQALGELPTFGMVPRDSCRVGDRLAVIMDPEYTDAEPVTAVVFFDGKAWSKPLVIDGELPRGFRTHCTDKEVVLTALDAPVIFQSRCTPERCTEARAVLELPGSPWMTDVGGKLLVVWNDGPSIWMRLAPIGELESAPDVLLLDDAGHRGIDGDVDGAYAQGDAALVMIEDHAADETHFLRVDPTGKVSVVKRAE